MTKKTNTNKHNDTAGLADFSPPAVVTVAAFCQSVFKFTQLVAKRKGAESLMIIIYAHFVLKPRPHP